MSQSPTKNCDLCHEPIPQGTLWLHQFSERGAGLAQMYVPNCSEVDRLCVACNSFVVGTFETLTRDYFQQACDEFADTITERFNNE